MTDLLYGVTGQTVTHRPQRSVDSATWVVEDLRKGVDASDRELASGAATVPASSLTVDATAGYTQASSTKIPVSSTTGAVTGPWRIEDAEGRGELVFVIGWTSDDYLRTRSPIVGEYDTGSTVRPLEISATIPDAIVTDEDNLDGVDLRIVWSYELFGVQERAQQQLNLVRQRHGDAMIADVIDFAALYFPRLPEQTRHNGELDRWATLARRMVEADLRGHGEGIEPAQFLGDDRLLQMVGFQLLQIAADNGIGPAARKIEDWQRIIELRLENRRASLLVGHPGRGVVETDEDDESVTIMERPGFDFAG